MGKLNIPPSLVVFSGPPLTGKTRLARKLSEVTDICVLDVDEIRHRLFPDESKKRSSAEIEKERMMVSYTKMYDDARQCIKEGKAVLVVATHSKTKYHELFVQLTTALSVPLFFFRIHTPHAIIERRLKKRLRNPNEQSNIRTMDDYLDVANRFQEYEGEKVILDSTKPTPENISIIQSTLLSSSR